MSVTKADAGFRVHAVVAQRNSVMVARTDGLKGNSCEHDGKP